MRLPVVRCVGVLSSGGRSPRGRTWLAGASGGTEVVEDVVLCRDLVSHVALEAAS